MIGLPVYFHCNSKIFIKIRIALFIQESDINNDKKKLLITDHYFAQKNLPGIPERFSLLCCVMKRTELALPLEKKFESGREWIELRSFALFEYTC
jgi:hypothetical protein